MKTGLKKSDSINTYWSLISDYYLMDENKCIEELLQTLDENAFSHDAAEKFAHQLVAKVRDKQQDQSSIEGNNPNRISDHKRIPIVVSLIGVLIGQLNR